MSEPEKKRRVGQPTGQALRWTLSQAAYEFSTDAQTLEKRRRALGIEPGEDDGKFSSMDIKKMLFGDKEAEMIGKIAAERRQIELKNAITERNQIEVPKVLQRDARIIIPMRQRILTSRLSDGDKEDLLKDLEAFGTLDWDEG